jgi:photosystem II stability/assembly factor-like uncharacterized protein
MFRGVTKRAAAGISILCLALAACGSPSQSLRTSKPKTSTSTSAAAPTSSTPVLSGQLLAQSATFISDDDAWVLAASQCGSGWCPEIRHTTDRGQSWTTIASPPTPIDGDGPQAISVLRFADADDGFAFYPGLWVTHDAGAQWHQEVLPGAVLALAAANREAYAVVVPCWPFSAPCTTPASLWRSPAGSDSWQQVSGVVLPFNTTPDLQLQGSAVYLLASATSTFLGAEDGIHFEQLADPCTSQDGFLSQPVSFALSTPSDLAVLCGGGAAAGSEMKEVLVSSDGGNSYKQVAGPPFGGGAGEIAAASPSTLVVSAISGASSLYRTSGADAAWSIPLEFGDGGIGFTDLGFTDSTDGVVIRGPNPIVSLASLNQPGLGTLYLTDDAGATWSAVNINS